MATEPPNQNSIGAWRVTQAELQAARLQARGKGELSKAAFHVVRYCTGRTFEAKPAMDWLRAFREHAPLATSEALSG